MPTKTSRRVAPQPRRQVRLAAGLVVVLLGTGIAIAVTRTHGSPTTSALGGNSGQSSSTSVPLRVAQITPAPHATGVAFNAPVEIHFSTALSSSWKAPVLTPAVHGTWSQKNAQTLLFKPSGFYVPSETVHIAIPADDTGISSTTGTTLNADFTSSFTIASGSITRLQQLLAELNYLPVSFQESTDSGADADVSGATGAVAATNPSSAAALSNEPTNAADISLDAQSGSFEWRYGNVPTQLASQWSPGGFSVVTQGAVMAFESDHNLAIDGEPGPAVWADVLQAVANRSTTSRPYGYVLVTETLPESLFVWQDGSIVYSSRANTGATGAATPLGTWPVYLRFTATTMKGTNPDGTHYVDKGVPWVSYFHGSDAVHGYVRPSYGSPQSNGCVELPLGNAASVYPMDPAGTLVTVTTGNLAAQLSVPMPPPVILSTPATTPTSVPTTTIAPVTTTTVPKPKHITTTTVAPTTTVPATTTTVPVVTTTTLPHA